MDEVENTNVKPKLPHKISQPKAQSTSEYKLAVLRVSKSIRQASAALGLSADSLLRLARQHGIPYQSRPKKISHVDKQEIIASLEAGHTASETASAYKVSLATVYRFSPYSGQSKMPVRELQSKRRLDAARKSWLAALEQNPGSTVTEIRHKLGAEWSYLYRHDPGWLRMHSPKRTKSRIPGTSKTHAALLAVAVGALNEASEQCESTPSAPIRRSAYRLQALSGLSEYQIDKLLHSANVRQLNVASETQSSFVARRIRWVTTVDPDAAYVPAWRLAKRIGLRSCSVVSVLYQAGSLQVALKVDEGDE
jgi:transposase